MRNFLIICLSAWTFACAGQYNRTHYELLRDIGPELPSKWALYELDTLIFPEVIHAPVIEMTLGNPDTKFGNGMHMVSVYLFEKKHKRKVKALARKSFDKPDEYYLFRTESYIVFMFYPNDKRYEVFNREVGILAPALEAYFKKHSKQL